MRRVASRALPLGLRHEPEDSRGGRGQTLPAPLKAAGQQSRPSLLLASLQASLKGGGAAPVPGSSWVPQLPPRHAGRAPMVLPARRWAFER